MKEEYFIVVFLLIDAIKMIMIESFHAVNMSSVKSFVKGFLILF